MWIFTPWVDRAFGPVIWPILGIIFFPLTTLLYVILWNTGGRGVTGWEWIFLILALFGDLASLGGVGSQRGALCPPASPAFAARFYLRRTPTTLAPDHARASCQPLDDPR